LATMRIPLRSNSSGDIYDFRSMNKGGTIVCSATSSGDLWH
uniref:Uncharacterized protein n=1 Tax=Aegilops tauschii subsp. strangulata TaxID=200361 RepID=A0A453MSE9_AEGTS